MLDSFLLLGTLAITSVPLFMSFQKRHNQYASVRLCSFSMRFAGLFDIFSFKLYETFIKVVS